MRLTPNEERLLRIFQHWQLELADDVRKTYPRYRHLPFDETPAWERYLIHWFRSRRSRDLKLSDVHYEFQDYRLTRTGFYGTFHGVQ